ncbi:MAG: hypothetical protein ABIH11_03160 [Candidatus Altiarchaeota archaeon]
MGKGDTELAVGGALGGLAVGEVLVLGVACPLCVVGAAVLLAAGGLKKVRTKVGKSCGSRKIK